MLKRDKVEYASSAKVIGDALVLSLPDAVAPVVWRMELGEIKAAAFEIRPDGEMYTLIMKTPKGTPQEIAPFDNKDKALRALMETSRAMERAAGDTGKSAPANDAGRGHVPAPRANEGKSHLIAGIIAVLILGGLIFGLMQAGPRVNTMGDSLGPTGVSGTAPTANGSAAGVPVSADDFLRNR